MKNIFLTIAFVSWSLSLSAQSTVGLIAHWDMNGGVTDVTGNGHDGHPTNVTPVAGMHGVPNTAYEFNGINSVITAGYLPDLNLTTYSICAIVNVQGFYSGLCQANCIFTRGKHNIAGGYMLYFSDNAFDGNNCSALDTNKHIFLATSGGRTAPHYAWQYTPQISRDRWYRVVATWDGTYWKIYSDDTLRVSVLNTGGTFGSSSDSISIGKNIFEAAAGYPYFFKGYIDDIRIYNRVLSDLEISQYGDSCGDITAQPADVLTTVGSNVAYTVTTSIDTPSFQWQQDAGTGYVNLSNAGPFTGVYTDTLHISGVVSTMNGNKYRCTVTNTVGCMAVSDSASLSIATKVNDAFTADMIKVFPNPVQGTLSIQVPNGVGKVKVYVINGVGQTLVTETLDVSSFTSIDVSSLAAAVYYLKIDIDGRVFYKRLIKND